MLLIDFWDNCQTVPSEDQYYSDKIAWILKRSSVCRWFLLLWFLRADNRFQQLSVIIRNYNKHAILLICKQAESGIVVTSSNNSAWNNTSRDYSAVSLLVFIITWRKLDLSCFVKTTFYYVMVDLIGAESESLNYDTSYRDNNYCCK